MFYSPFSSWTLSDSEKPCMRARICTDVETGWTPTFFSIYYKEGALLSALSSVLVALCLHFRLHLKQSSQYVMVYLVVLYLCYKLRITRSMTHNLWSLQFGALLLINLHVFYSAVRILRTGNFPRYNYLLILQCMMPWSTEEVGVFSERLSVDLF